MEDKVLVKVYKRKDGSNPFTYARHEDAKEFLLCKEETDGSEDVFDVTDEIIESNYVYLYGYEECRV